MRGFFAALRMNKCFYAESVLGVGAVALLVFLSGAAWARVVAAYFFAGAAGRCAVAVSCGGADGAGLLEFALFFLVEFALEGINRCGWRAIGYGGGCWLARRGSIGVRWRAAGRPGSREFLLELRLGCGCGDLGLSAGELLG